MKARQRAPTPKTEEAVDHRQNNNYVKAVGTSPLRSNWCTRLIAVSTAVQSRVTKTVSAALLLSCHREQSWTYIHRSMEQRNAQGSRRDQEEGGGAGPSS